MGYGPMRVNDEPEALGQGKYRVRATLKDGSQITFTTFEGTIGNILASQGGKGYAEPYFSEDVNSKGLPYINWRTWEGE